VNKLLYIKSSPRGADSKSAAVADAYLAALRQRLPALAVDTLDLAVERIADFDGNNLAAKIAVIAGQRHEGARKTAWDEIAAVANRFIAADRYLFAVPMWNGGVPYRLKQYIDVIHQPGLLWGLDPQKGYFGLLKDNKAVLALTSGAFGPSMPSPAFGVDHHSTYLKAWLNRSIKPASLRSKKLRFQPTLLNPDPHAGLKAAIGAAGALAARF
jgi:FMN-dependent NADH-azoreductase